jgi:hypothetical protein
MAIFPKYQDLDFPGKPLQPEKIELVYSFQSGKYVLTLQDGKSMWSVAIDEYLDLKGMAYCLEDLTNKITGSRDKYHELLVDHAELLGIMHEK